MLLGTSFQRPIDWRRFVPISFGIIQSDYAGLSGVFSAVIGCQKIPGFFLCGQMLNFLHRLLQRIVTRDCLPEGDDWDTLLQSDFTSAQLLSVSQFMEETEFRTEAMRAAKRRINVEREKKKKVRTEVVAGTVMGEMFNPLVDQGRTYIRYVCKDQSSSFQI